MRVAAYQSDGMIHIENRAVPQIGPGEILLRVKVCGLCGTDLLKLQKKSSKPGTVLGHEVAGVVAQIGSGVQNFREGDRVVVAHHVPCYSCHYCRHENFSMCRHFRQTNLDPGGFAEFLRIPAEHVQKTTLKIPDHLSFEEASFTEPLACCARAVRRSRLLEGDSVLIIGLGSIGLTLVQLFSLEKMRIFVADLIPERVQLAKTFGAESFDSSKSPFEDRGFDMILMTGGTYQFLSKTLPWIREGGKIHLFSSLIDDGKEVPLSSLDLNQIYHRELELIATYSSSPEDLQEAFQILSEKKINVQPLIEARFELEDISKAIDQMRSKKILKALIYMNDA